MERLETVKDVKEAVHRLLSKPARYSQIDRPLKNIVEALIQYCDCDDGVQRSLFNDYFNYVLLAFQYQKFELIFDIMLEELVRNHSARRVAAVLSRIPPLIDNVGPVELGCNLHDMLKALIEIARRSCDESVQKSLGETLKSVLPFLEYHVRTEKQIKFLANSLMEVLLRNLYNASTQIRRITAHNISVICSVSGPIMDNTLLKLKTQLDVLLSQTNAGRFTGICLCAKELYEFSKLYHLDIIQVIFNHIQSDVDDTTALTGALETLREILNDFEVSESTLLNIAELIAKKFLVDPDEKVILQTNALACLIPIIRQQPNIFNSMQHVLEPYKSHRDVAVRNQLILMIGYYISSSWRFPRCVDHSLACSRTRKLWIELRSLTQDSSTNPENLKSCLCSIKVCISSLLEMDHCLHIVEYQDFERLLYIYSTSNFKPLKSETLELFATLNYTTLYYLERQHWSKLKIMTASPSLVCLQDRIINELIVPSLKDEHLRIRSAAITALIKMIPNLHVINSNELPFRRPNDPIVSLANNLACNQMVLSDHSSFDPTWLLDKDDSLSNPDSQVKLLTRIGREQLSSSIIQESWTVDESDHCVPSHVQENITINLSKVVKLLKESLENSLACGKNTIVFLVKAIYDLSIAYPIQKYPFSWDCRQSEYCDSFVLLDFLMAYLRNLTEPDVIISDLDAYKIFLSLMHQLLYALCHESVLSDYEIQRMKPFEKRLLETKDGDWSEVTIKHPGILEKLQIYFVHLTKLLCIFSNIIEERNPFSRPQASQQTQSSIQHIENDALNSKPFLTKVFKKLEASFRSSKKNLDQRNERFYQILSTCLSSMSSLLEFISMSTSIIYVREIVSHLRVVSTMNPTAPLVCARQLLKSLFGINIIALYQVDPFDWFEDEMTSSYELSSKLSPSVPELNDPALQGVYYHLIANPYRIFSHSQSRNPALITQGSDQGLTVLNSKSIRALRVRCRVENRIKALFESNPNQIMPPKTKQVSEVLKTTIADFTPIVTDSMCLFATRGFCVYQSDTLHLMCYLLMIRVNYHKLQLATDMIKSINKILDNCADRVYTAREHNIGLFLRTSFTFFTLLTYERGPSKPLLQIAAVIQRFDDLRAKLSLASAPERDVTTYIAPLLSCLVEDLFIYRTEYFQTNTTSKNQVLLLIEKEGLKIHPSSEDQSLKDMYDLLEAGRETIAQKLLDVIGNPGVYDLLSILVLESRRNSSEIKYKKFSQHLLSIIPDLLSKRSINLANYKRLEVTRRILENISPEVFQPIEFIEKTLLESPKPPKFTLENMTNGTYRSEFERWMSLVIITIHILTTQVKEEKFLSRNREFVTDQNFAEYLLHIVQLCAAEVVLQLWCPVRKVCVQFLTQQLSCYLLYITHMFQSGLFYQLSRGAANLIKDKAQQTPELPADFRNLCLWSRTDSNGFSLHSCEIIFYHMRFIFPDLTISWCNLMSLLNNVDCNQDFWRNLLVYECHNCFVAPEQSLSEDMDNLKIKPSADAEIVEESLIETQDSNKLFKRSSNINRPSSLNLSDVSFNDQLRRSFIKKIAAAETRDKTLNRNIVETSNEDGQVLEREMSIGNTEQCLAPNIELTRRGVLCLVLDFVSISMNDVEHITWLIIHHINDIIRWSHETPIAEFINSVHGNPASSGIFIQAINTNLNNLTSISFVARLLWTLERVHYTQYGSLVVLLVEKLLCSKELMLYRSLTRKVEEFACETVQKLLDETNKSLVVTNDEVMNQLGREDLDRIISLLDTDLYSGLVKLLIKLRESSQDPISTPIIELHKICDGNSDDDERDCISSDSDDVENLYKLANLILWLTEQGYCAQISRLTPALNTMQLLLSQTKVINQVNKDESLICFLISAIYNLALNVIPPPTRLSKPRLWLQNDDTTTMDQTDISRMDPITDRKKIEFVFDNTFEIGQKPAMPIGHKRPTVEGFSPTSPGWPCKQANRSKEELIETARLACLECLFLFDNTDYLQMTSLECIIQVIIRLARLPLVNSFVSTPPIFWRQNIWPPYSSIQDEYKVQFPIVTHDILIKDITLLDSFCDRVLKLGWIHRRQFEETWVTLLGVLSATLSDSQLIISNTVEPGFSSGDNEKRTSILASCKVINTLTNYLDLAQRSISGDPLAFEPYPAQSFDERVVELAKTIGNNLPALRKKVASLFESVELDHRRSQSRCSESSTGQQIESSSGCKAQFLPGFSKFLRASAQNLRLRSILNVELDLQDTVVIGEDYANASTASSIQTKKPEDVDVESCVRLILSIYKQKLSNPDQDLCYGKTSMFSGSLSIASNDAEIHQVQSVDTVSLNRAKSKQSSNKNQLPPPLVTAIVQSILALSDMFTEYEQFMWLFETFGQLLKIAERNEDEIQMQFLVIGLCKAVTVCCYEIPGELVASAAGASNSSPSAAPSGIQSVNQRDVMFERCRLTVERCVKSEFVPLKISALHAVFYMLEDSIKIVASGAWELDDFKRLRQMRLAWIMRLMTIILDKHNGKCLSSNGRTMKLLESLCEIVTESELKAMRNV